MQMKDFLRKLGGVGAITLGDRAVAVVLGILLVRWLGNEDYGVYSFAMATTSLLLIGVRFGLPEWLIREISPRSDSPQDIAGRRLHRTVLLLVLASGLLVPAAGAVVLFAATDPGPLRHALLVGLLLLPFNALLDTLDHALRGWGRIVPATIFSNILPTLVSLSGAALLFLVLRVDGSASLALELRLLALGLAVLLAFRALRRAYRPRDHRATGDLPPQDRLEALRGAFPFMLIGSVAVILSRTDVFMLGLMSDFEQTGLYNIAAQGGGLVLLILNVSNAITTPQFARLHRAGDRAAFEAFAIMAARTVAAVGIPLGALLIALGEPLLTLLFGPDTGPAYQPLAILVAGYALALLFGAPGFILNMSGHEKVSLKVIAASAMLNIVLNAMAIPGFGASGAALATAISLLAQRALMVAMVRRHVGISCNIFGL